MELGDLPAVLGNYPMGSSASGTNDFGQVVGTSFQQFGSHAVVWNNDAAHTPFALPPLPGDSNGVAGYINNTGHVIGYSYYRELAVLPFDGIQSPCHLVVWRDGSVFELQTLLDAATGAGWTLTSVGHINNLGQMAGTGVHNGETRAILLTPLPG